MKEDVSPAAPTTAPNTSLGIKAGPILIGRKNKDKNGKTSQGSQSPPSGSQIIMASYEWDKQPVVKGKKRLRAIVNPMDKTNQVFVSANEAKITAKDVKMHLAVHKKIDDLAAKSLEGKGELDETLTKSAEAGDWIHDFVHSKNSKFEGKSKKERIRMALGAYYAKQNEAVNEAQAHDDTMPQKGDFIHAGYGQLGGAGVHGHVLKIEGNRVHFTGSDTHIGINGKPYKKKFIAPVKHVTVLHREDYIVDFEEDIEPILEAARKKLSVGVVGDNDPAALKFQQARDPLPVKENFADWHETMEKRGTTENPVEFKVKNAGGRTEAHHQGKRIGAYDHNKRQEIKEEEIVEAKKKPHEHKEGDVVHFSGKSLHGEFEGHTVVRIINPHSNKHLVTHTDKHGTEYEGANRHIRLATVERPERPTRHGIPAIPAKRFEAHHYSLHRGENMHEAFKRKYLGKTRGTTATGKPAHAVVMDPVLKLDDTAANRKQALPAPDRGI